MKYIHLYTTKNYILNTQQHNKIVQYIVYIRRLILLSEFLNDNNDLKLTILGGKLFHTLMMRSQKKFLAHGMPNSLFLLIIYSSLCL